MSWFKPGQKVHRIAQVASIGWWRRRKRVSLLSGHLGRFRMRNKLFAQKVDASAAAKGASHDAPPLRRGVSADPKWGLRMREWSTGLTERTLLLLVESLLLMKSVGGFWQDLWLAGRELLSRRFSPVADPFLTFQEDVLRGRMQNGCRTGERDAHWERVEVDPIAVAELPILQRTGLREEVERAKIFTLDSEEEDLPEDLLTDQAGALRSRLAGTAHEEGER
ncbi:MAG: hypothetical protein H7836_00255 [Magnetococcus sp. YQC-3]